MILIKNLFELKGYNAKQLVGEFAQQRLERVQRLEVTAKATGYWDGRPVVPATADDAAPAQLIALILLTNWC